MSFGEKIKELRLKHSLTQKEFATKLSLTPANVGAWEKDLKKPSYEILLQIAKEFNVSLDWLCDINNDESKPIKTWTDLIKQLYSILTYPHRPWKISISDHNGHQGKLTVSFFHYLLDPDMFTHDIMATPEERNSFFHTTKAEYDNEKEENGFNFYSFENPVYNFIMDYYNLKNLLDEGRIKQEIFDMWLKDQYERYNYEIWKKHDEPDFIKDLDFNSQGDSECPQ